MAIKPALNWVVLLRSHFVVCAAKPLFAKACTESFATPNVYTTGSDEDKVELSTVEAVSIGVAEVGISLAKCKLLWANTSHLVTHRSNVFTHTTMSRGLMITICLTLEKTVMATLHLTWMLVRWFFGPFRVGTRQPTRSSQETSKPKIRRER